MRNSTPLFWSQDGHAIQQATLMEAVACVAHLTEEQVLNTDPEELVTYISEKFDADVPSLDMDNVVASQHERPIEVRDIFDNRSVQVAGTAFDFEIPFTGDPGIFQIRPSTFDTAPPHALLRGNLVCFSVTGRDLTGEQVKQALAQTTGSIQKYLQFHRDFWAGWKAKVANQVRPALQQRRDRLLQQQGVAASLEGIGIKLKEKPNDPRTFQAPAIKQKLAPQMPPMRAKQKPEPTLPMEQYEIILGLLGGAGRSIEQSSSRTRVLDEETLRDMMLVPLNAHFGGASGEAFNYSGKSDIVVKHEGKNLFVAECKFWHGEKGFLDAISQLLGYLTWRDTKAVLIIFTKNVGFSSVVAQLAKGPATHPSFVAGPRKLEESVFQFTFKLPQDADRQVTLTVMGFDLGKV